MAIADASDQQAEDAWHALDTVVALLALLAPAGVEIDKAVRRRR